MSERPQHSERSPESERPQENGRPGAAPPEGALDRAADRAPAAQPTAPAVPAGPDVQAGPVVRRAVESRPGFQTMPTELRAFRQGEPDALKLTDLPEAAAAAQQLREMGRGGDVLFEKLPDAPPREVTQEGARAEHVVITMPGGVRPDGRTAASPWAQRAEAAKQAASNAIDKDALPSATAPSSGPPPSVTDKAQPAASTKPGEQPRRRPWVWGVAVLACAAAIGVAALLGSPDERSGVAVATGGAPGGATGATAPVAGGSRPSASVEPAMTGAAMTGVAMVMSAPTSAAGASTGTAATGASTGAATAKKGPKGPPDLYIDAGAVPKASATVEPGPAPVLTAVPSVTPAITAAPSTTTRPIAPFGVRKD
jgi:hypothetical protein